MWWRSVVAVFSFVCFAGIARAVGETAATDNTGTAPPVPGADLAPGATALIALPLQMDVPREEANPLFGSMADSPAGLAVVDVGGGTLINDIAYNLRKAGKQYWSVPQIAAVTLFRG